MKFFEGLKEKFKYAFSIPDEKSAFSEKDIELIEKIAKVITDRGMGGPAVLFLEGVKPLNFIGSQILVFMSPYIKMVFNRAEDIKRVEEILEKRTSIEILIQKIIDKQNTLEREGK